MKRKIAHLKLKQYIADTGLTQAQFANQLGIAPAYLSQILHGIRKPSGELICRLAKTSGDYFTVHDFHGDEAIYG